MKEIDSVIESLELIHSRLKLNIPERKRPVFKQLDIDNTRDVIIYGSRGVGKTTFLLHKSRDRNFFYFSADNPLTAPFSLFQLVEAAFKKGYDGVVIDEVHFSKNWEQNLKAIYDSFPEKFIWASGSSNLALKFSRADLSRRYVTYRLPMLSFREFLYLKEGIELPPVNPFDYQSFDFSILNRINILSVFREYLSSGIRPFFQEGNYCERLSAVVEKSIFFDVPFFVPAIQDNHLRVMNAILGHLIFSPVPTINISKMCSSWHISKEKLYTLLSVMEQTEILKIVRTRRDAIHQLTKGAKIFLHDPSIYSCFKGNTGTQREAFVVFALSERFKVYASDREEEYDYLVSGMKIEIGGKHKKSKKADFVISDDIDVPVKNRIPLWLLGMAF
ncbi:ATP-binding protein [Persephonella sp.]